PVFMRLVASARPTLTTPLVLYECGNAATRRPYRTTVDDLRLWLATNDWLIEPAPSDFDRAWAEYRAGHAGAPGIVDHASFQVMRCVGMAEAFTNARHFKAAGFTVLF